MTHLQGHQESPSLEFPDGRLIDLTIISWDTLPGKHYTLLHSADLSTNSWHPVDDPTDGDGHPAAIAITLTDAQGHAPDRQFWRVRIEDTDSDADPHEITIQWRRGASPAWMIRYPEVAAADWFLSLSPGGTLLYRSADFTTYSVFTPGLVERQVPADPPAAGTGFFGPFGTPLHGDRVFGFNLLTSDPFETEWAYLDPQTNQITSAPIPPNNPPERIDDATNLHVSGVGGGFGKRPDGTTPLFAGDAGMFESNENAISLGNGIRYWTYGNERLWLTGHWSPLKPLLPPRADDGLLPEAIQIHQARDTGLIAAGIRYPGGDWKHAVITPVHLQIHHPQQNTTIPWNDYLPGYALDEPVLCKSKDENRPRSFENLDYHGPQEIHLRFSGPATELADAIELEILEVTSHRGWAGNAGESQEEDFLFSASSDSHHTTAQVTGGTASVPIHCKDYGGWAKLRLILKKNGIAIHPDPIILTLPHDANGDRIADYWQRAEIRLWNHQYRLKPGDPNWINLDDPDTWTAIFGSQGEEDAELADSDGPDGPMPPMADDGDGLTALEEYRGFFLDGGPSITTPQHRRLSVARKELLVECSVMDGIGSVTGSLVIPDSDFEDQGNDANAFAQAFDVDESMATVAELFAKSGASGQHGGYDYFLGGDFDLWWVKDTLNDGADNLFHVNSAAVSDYKYSGPYTDLQSNNSTRNGWLSIYFNHEMWVQDRPLHDTKFGLNRNGVGIVGNLGNRNTDCEKFVKLVFQGRKGQRNALGIYVAMSNEAAREVDEAMDPSIIHQGATIFVNSLSEEKPGGAPWIAQQEFISRMDFSIAHELAHLFVIGRNRVPGPNGGIIAISPFDEGEHISGNNNLLFDPVGFQDVRFHEEEIRKTHLRQRASVHSNPHASP